MFKFILFIVITVLNFGCADKENNVNTLTAEETLIGNWNFFYVEPDCEEIWEFGADKDFKSTSLNEVVTGIYSLSEITEENGKLPIEIEIQNDNLQVDCRGNVSDDSGVKTNFLVEFPDQNTMHRYFNENTSLYLVLKRK